MSRPRLEISDADRQRLLRLARESLTTHLSGKGVAMTPTLEGAAAEPGAAFVTVTAGGHLRGCIGNLACAEPLGIVVARCAISAATSDPRFPAVTHAELPDVLLEISVLGPLERASGPAAIQIGRHGLVVERGGRRGLLLPQVAAEWQWNSTQFLEHTCRKAGLPPDSWKADALIWTFEAVVFGEDD